MSDPTLAWFSGPHPLAPFEWRQHTPGAMPAEITASTCGGRYIKVEVMTWHEVQEWGAAAWKLHRPWHWASVIPWSRTDEPFSITAWRPHLERHQLVRVIEVLAREIEDARAYRAASAYALGAMNEKARASASQREGAP